MARRLWLVFVIVVAACGGGRKNVRTPGKPWLSTIRVEGNKSVETEELTEQIALSRAVGGDWILDPYQVSLDTKRIRAAYLRYGFFDVEVTSRVDTKRVENTTASTVVFLVKEGKRARMNVVITGLPPEVALESARALVELPDGAPFDYEVYDDAKELLVQLVEDAGYAHVQLDAAVIAEKRTNIATARYAFEAGPRSQFGKVTIQGVDGDLATAVQNRLMFAEGELYSAKALIETQRNLYELNRFSTVRITPDRTGGPNPIVPVTIAVSTGTRHEIRAGGGVGYEPLTYEARVRGGGSLIPENHLLWTLAADGRVAATVSHDGEDFEPKIRTLVSASRLDLFLPRLNGEFAVGFDYLTTEAFTTTGPLARIGLVAPLGYRWLQLRVGWDFSYFRFVKISEFIDGSNRGRFRLDHDQQLGSFQQAIAADLRDNPIDTRKGVYAALKLVEGHRIAGSAYQYAEVLPDLRGYLPLGPLVLALRLRGGEIFGSVPATERFFSGGAQSHRGFSERELAPSITGTAMGDDGPVMGSVLIGGSAFVETGAELRIPIGEVEDFLIGATVFLDGGDVVANRDQLDFTNLHWATGVGVSAKAGGIKLRVDVGHRLNRTTPADPQYETGTLSNTEVHVGVGDTF